MCIILLFIFIIRTSLKTFTELLQNCELRQHLGELNAIFTVLELKCDLFYL